MNVRRKQVPRRGAGRGYLISFGDTMTALLAFFIVLATLAKDQTGANLHAGTGSFQRAVRGLGIGGRFSTDSSDQFQQLRDAAPLYTVGEDRHRSPETSGEGPDEVGNELRVLDRDREEFTRVLTELEQLFKVRSEGQSAGSVVFDLFDQLNRQPPLLPAESEKVVSQAVRATGRPGYQLEIVVWATTPGRGPWTRAAVTAQQLRREIIERFGLDSEHAARIRADGRPWFDSNAQRPVVSLVVIKSK